MSMASRWFKGGCLDGALMTSKTPCVAEINSSSGKTWFALYEERGGDMVFVGYIRTRVSTAALVRWPEDYSSHPGFQTQGSDAFFLDHPGAEESDV